MVSGIATFLMTSSTWAQSVNIAPMTWNQRSDWINVKTDPNISPHATGDGVTDDTAALQSALNLASTSLVSDISAIGKRTVYLPPGTYKISSTLTWNTGNYGITGLSLIGSGSNTTIAWSGAGGGTIFKSTGVSRARYIGMKWNGNSVAASAIWFEPHNTSNGIAEAPVRIENNAFVGFTGAALNFQNRSGTEWTGQADVWNCLFYLCHIGAQIDPQGKGNNFEYMFERCEFEYCDTGIDSYGNTAQMVFDTHFDHSSIADMTAKMQVRARRCTSTNSKMFFASPYWSGSAGNLHVFQDCWVDSWKNTGGGGNSGAIQIGDRCLGMIFDCKFTGPPNGNPPINLTNPNWSTETDFLVSNNSCPGFSSQTAMVQTGSNGGAANVLPINVAPAYSNWGITKILGSPNFVFLNSGAYGDGPILDVVTQYGAANDTTVDARNAIQAAIDQARNNNNGSIVYIPAGYYKIGASLNVSGGNYTIQGCGFYSQLCWTGADGGALMSVDTPNNVKLSSFVVKVANTTPSAVGIKETAGGPGKLTVDWVYFFQYGPGLYPGNSNPLKNLSSLNGGQGLLLDGLPAGSLTSIGLWAGPIHIRDCGRAEILGNHINGGQLTVEGANYAPIGFLGFLYSNMGFVAQQTSLYDIVIKNNQDFVSGDFYNEQTVNNLSLEGGSSWNGRVAIQGFRQQGINSTAINANNYRGRLFYGPQGFENYNPSGSPLTVNITQTGGSLLDMVLVADAFHHSTPNITRSGTVCHLIEALDEWRTDNWSTLTPMAPVPNPLASGDYASIEAGLDHLRQLGLEDLKVLNGWNLTVLPPPPLLANPGFESDSVWARPPSGWSNWGQIPSDADVAYSQNGGLSHSGNMHLTHWRGGATGWGNVKTVQMFIGIPNGTYTFRAWGKATSSSVHGALAAEAYQAGGGWTTAPIPVSGTYQQITLTIPVSNNQCQVSLWSYADTGNVEVDADDFEFFKNP
ncbi:MAG: glycosyl hydrolase family 28-related protein [Terrimicrobiaceae bacterium]|nr:glycosyl hydrolase family 28-related protein [Terrimicrobiaceae bacterium]